MNENALKFEELVQNNEDVRNRLQKAMENYSGEHTEKAVFETIFLPVAEEYGIPATFEEFMEYLQAKATSKELSVDEMAQVAGGKYGGGVVMQRCDIVGFGAGAGGGNGAGGVCALLGFGWGFSGCLTVGASGPIG